MEQKIIINSKKQKLIGLLRKNESQTLFIICHGFQGSKDDYCIKELALKLYLKNYSTFRFSFSEHGEFNIVQEVEDLNAVVNYFTQQFTSIILVGGSLGALITSITAIKNNKVSKLITINGFFYPFFGIAWRYYRLILIALLSFPFLKTIRNISRFYFDNFKPNKIKVPTLIIYGNQDRILNPNHQSRKFFSNLITAKEIKQIDSIDHDLSKKEYVQVTVEEIVKWLNKY